MSRTISAEELKLIESIVAAHPSSVGIADIEAEIVQRRGDRVWDEGSSTMPPSKRGSLLIALFSRNKTGCLGGEHITVGTN
jgi:hypothetical protein